MNFRHVLPRHAFTLIEIMVVMIIISVLAALILPAVQQVREAARRTSCANNLHQIGLAMANYEGAHGFYPPSWKPTPVESNGRVNGWSVWALLLPHLDQGGIYSHLSFDQGYQNAPIVTAADGSTIKINALRIPTYLCPSEVRDEAKLDSTGAPGDYPNNYAVNLGTWFIYNPATGEGGPGAFYPNSRVRTTEFRDGMSFTLCAAEVKAWQPNVSSGGLAGPLALPKTAADVTSLAGTFNASSGHTEWADGRSNHSGFTTTFPPNAAVPFTDPSSGTTYDIDWVNQREGTSSTISNWGALTARSYHAGVVNCVMMDASVRTISNEIDLGVWRAFSTRNGGELIPSKYQGP
ncbi:MAG TPA: DUF1559 domain-containing protein [Pirellulales bacterium]|jgi:prepilin-type N-terminal cleavage/methylation domain-containing protein|nr:DUF1559 domain-containing protein [Pirellulales bacterium]